MSVRDLELELTAACDAVMAVKAQAAATGARLMGGLEEQRRIAAQDDADSWDRAVAVAWEVERAYEIEAEAAPPPPLKAEGEA